MAALRLLMAVSGSFWVVFINADSFLWLIKVDQLSESQNDTGLL